MAKKKHRVVMHTMRDGTTVRPLLGRELRAELALAAAEGRTAGRPVRRDIELALPPTVEAIEADVADEMIDRALSVQRASASQLYATLTSFAKELAALDKSIVAITPPLLNGILHNPEGAPAANVAIALEPAANPPAVVAPASRALTSSAPPPSPVPAATPWMPTSTVTDSRGAFALRLPRHMVPAAGLVLRVWGGGGGSAERIDVSRELVAAGDVGTVTLRAPARPLFRGASRPGARPMGAHDLIDNRGDFTEPAADIRLGEEDGAGAITFRSNDVEISKHRFNVLIRLTDPLLSGFTSAYAVDAGGKTLVGGTQEELARLLGSFVASNSQLRAALEAAVTRAKMRLELRQRIPVLSPIDVPGFQDAVETNSQSVIKAASLGLGYVVGMQQVWLPNGYSLGDLVYSLPLAPGEEQRIAVVERVETMSVRESESLEEAELVTFDEEAESSAESVFKSSVTEQARGGSHVESSTTTWGVGAALGLGGVIPDPPLLIGGGAAGGVAQTNAAGDTNSWQRSSRDAVSQATEQLHSSLSRQASARRRATRTSVRLATATDRQRAVTKVIANHNHSHALTIQYWEVLRHFAVTSRATDVQLVCFVPLQLVDFMNGQKRELGSIATGDGVSRDMLIERYQALLRSIDVVERCVARRPLYREGVRHARRLAADPTIQIEGAGANAAISFSLKGTFLACDRIEASIVLHGGRRLRSRRMNYFLGLPEIDTTSIRNMDELTHLLRGARDGRSGHALVATLELPPGVNPEQIVAIEVRRFTSDYTAQVHPFGAAESAVLGALAGVPGGLPTAMGSQTVTIAGDRLDALVGPPRIWDVELRIPPSTEPDSSSYMGIANAVELGGSLLIDVGRIAPVMTFDELLKIEALFQHVVRNTTEYSKAVWASLTAEERALMLERFTVGMPPGGLVGADEGVPLLNCVTNRVLGFFGNSMIMPFSIPPALAKDIQMTNGALQDTLLRFHQQGFQAERSTVTLPTRGVLAEAVLGRNNSSEKIDLTRFWNWRDSPHESAADASALVAGERMLRGDIEGPSHLAQRSTVTEALAALMNMGRPELAGALARTLAQEAGKAPSGAGGLNLTGLDQLGRAIEATTAASKDAFQTSVKGAVDMGSKAMDMLPTALAAAAQFDQTYNPSRRKKEELEERKTEAEIKKVELESRAETMRLEEANSQARIGSLRSDLDTEVAEHQLRGANAPYPNFVASIGASGNPAIARAQAQWKVLSLGADRRPQLGEVGAAITQLRAALEGANSMSPPGELGLWALEQALGGPPRPAPTATPSPAATSPAPTSPTPATPSP